MNESKIFLIGDLHWGHRNIIKYCNRPFSDVEHMNEQLIKNWNSVVSKNDIVYVVGDFALCAKSKIIEIGNQLNGRKRLILGNHDGASIETYRAAGFEFVYNHSIVLDDFYIISHIPLPYIQPPFFNIHAHTHEFSNSENHFCVSAENIKYTPLNFEEVKRAQKY